VNAKLQLTNPREPLLSPIEVDPIADTGSVFLCIPEHVRLQLKLEVLEYREVTLRVPRDLPLCRASAAGRDPHGRHGPRGQSA
jgi:hypothetical protein